MKTLLLIAAIGTPLIGIYSSFVFWTFIGTVEMDEMS
jgi:cytochrome d ubiquinol oxidase subunit II